MLFGFQGKQILAQPLIIAMLAVPILVEVYFISGLAYLLNRWLVSSTAWRNRPENGTEVVKPVNRLRP